MCVLMSPLNESFINYLKPVILRRNLMSEYSFLQSRRVRKCMPIIQYIFEPMRFTQTGGRIGIDELLSNPETWII